MNQIEIQDTAKLLYKKKMKIDFVRKPLGNKSKFLNEARVKMMQELALETNQI